MGRGRSASFLPNNFLTISLRFAPLLLSSAFICRALKSSTGARNLKIGRGSQERSQVSTGARKARTVRLVYVVLIAPQGLEAATKNRTGNPAILNRVSHSGFAVRFYVTVPKKKKKKNDIIAQIDRIAISSPGTHLYGFESLHYMSCYMIRMFRRQIDRRWGSRGCLDERSTSFDQRL